MSACGNAQAGIESAEKNYKILGSDKSDPYLKIRRKRYEI
jgi:hypothetical protein